MRYASIKEIVKNKLTKGGKHYYGTAHIFEGKLYIQTGKVKDVSKQIHANPKVEICAFKNGE